MDSRLSISPQQHMVRSRDELMHVKDQTEAEKNDANEKSQTFLNDHGERIRCPSNTKPSVHYPENIDDRRPTMRKFDPGDVLTSSLALTNEDSAEDDYNWQTEDDLLDQEASKFNERLGLKPKRSRNLCFRILEFLVSTLVGTFITASLIATPGILVRALYWKRKQDAHRSYISDNVEAWCYWVASQLLISWLLAFILDIIPGIVTWSIFIVWGHISESMKSRVELYNTLKGTIKPLFYAGSAWASWVILFSGIFNLYNMNEEPKSRASYTPRLYEVIQFFFFLTLVLCMQRMLSLMNASIFHRTAFKDRLEATKKALRTIEHLKQYKPRPRDRSSKHFNVFSAPKFPFASGWGSYSRPETPPPNTDVFSVSEHEESTGDSEDKKPGIGLAIAKDKKSRKKDKRSHKKCAGTKSPSGSVSEADVLPAFSSVNSRGLVTSQSTKTSLHESLNGSGNASASGSQRDYHMYNIHPPRGTDPRTSTWNNSVHEALPTDPFTCPSYGQNHQRNAYPPKKFSAVDELKVTKNVVKTLKTAVLHDARNITGHKSADLSGLGWNVGSAHEAKRQARSIFEAFKASRRKYLMAEDFYPAYPTREEAEEAFRVFDTDNNGDITRAEIKTTIVKTYRERRSLTRSMRDIDEAIRLLDQILLVLALIILFFISLSVFNVDISKSLSSIYTVFIAASFVFKSCSSRAFDAIMFLFVTHPFDTGDRCFIKNENLVVKKMGLFATVFTRADGTETYYFNSQLFTQLIINARRSGKTTEQLTLQVAWKTPLEKLDALESCLNEWLSMEEHRWFEPNTSITIQKIVLQRYLEITIGIPHNGNWQDWGLTVSRKTAFCAATNYYCRQLGIKAVNLTMPIIFTDEDDDHDADWNNASSLKFSPFLASSTSEHMGKAHMDHDAGAEFPAARIPASRFTCEMEREAQNIESQEDVKPILGFLPPPDKRSKTLLRARKSKKANAFAKFDG